MGYRMATFALVLVTISMLSSTSMPVSQAQTNGLDPPPVIEVHLNDTYAEVNLSDITGSHEVELHGYVQTNYHWAYVQVYMDTHCAPHHAYVDPDEMLIVGKATIPFKVTVDIMAVTNDTSQYMGKFVATVIIDVPGMTKTASYFWTYQVVVEGTGTNLSQAMIYDTDTTHSTPEASGGGGPWNLVMGVASFGVAVTLFYIAQSKMGSMLRRRRRRRPSTMEKQ